VGVNVETEGVWASIVVGHVRETLRAMIRPKPSVSQQFRRGQRQLNRIPLNIMHPSLSFELSETIADRNGIPSPI
jgi:hypothetical protein